jgi:hypothetical protein
MSEEEINIAIAEHCSWRNIKEIDYQPFGTDPYIDGPHQMIVGIHPESDSDSDDYEAIPNYCSDLNEMHEAEKTLSRGQNYNQLCGYGFYITTLIQICYQDHVVNATASQRAEAFVRTIDKWKE